MKNTLLAIALCCLPALGLAAQTPVTPMGAFPNPATASINTLKAATNTKLDIIEANRQDHVSVLAAKADKSATVMLWGEWANGAAFTTASPPVVYNGAIYKCTAPYTKVSGETPDTQIDYFAEVTGSGGGITHATSDGAYYASKDGAWASLTGVFAAPLGTDDNYVTDDEKLKITSIATGAEVNVNADWNASSGDAQILNKPTIPSVSDTAYGVGWNGDTGAASKNALYDKIETIAGGTDDQTAAEVSVADIAGHYTATNVETVLAEIGAAPFISWDAATITEVENSPAVGTNTIGVKSGVFQAYDSDWLGVTANGASLISAANYAAMKTLLDLEPGADYDAATPSTLNLASDTDITASQLLSNKFISNQGASGEVDITLPAVSYSITRTVLVEETQIVEINPPSGEAFDLAGTMLDANDCIDSPPTVGAKAVFTRMQDASGVWHWSVDQVRGTWVDTGASD